MKKFEIIGIINNHWIKKLVFAENDAYNSHAMKFSAVIAISSSIRGDKELKEYPHREADKYSIHLHAHGDSHLHFYYNSSEKEQFENDLVFFEKSLFHNTI